MAMFWLKQIAADVPANNRWLTDKELACLNGLRFPKRRADWRLGRWTAKCAVACFLHLPSGGDALTHLEIRPAPSGAPEVLLNRKPAPVTISITHRDGVAACAVAPSGIAVGCDLETVEPRSDSFVADYLTTEEQTIVAAQTSVEDRSRAVALLWSAKESTLKALRVGLRLDTRTVVVTPDALPARGTERESGPADRALNYQQSDLKAWHPLRVRYIEGTIFHGWWRETDKLVLTMVSAPRPSSPVLLEIPPEVQTRKRPILAMSA